MQTRTCRTASGGCHFSEDPATAAIHRQRLEELDQSASASRWKAMFMLRDSNWALPGNEVRALQEQSDQGADVKQSILKAVVDACESGDLGVVLSAVGVDKSRSRIQALLEKSAETGELEAALKRTMDTKDVADLDKLKGHLRDVLLDANESGQVQDILAQMSRQPEKPEATEASATCPKQPTARFAHANEIEKLKSNLSLGAHHRLVKSLLLDANESGRVLAVLQEMSAEKAEEAGAQKALEEVSEMEQLKQRMKAALFDADPRGPASKTGAAPALPHATHELVNAQAKMQEGLRSGLLQQGLEKVMQKGDVKETKDRLRETMNEKAEREGLVFAADSIALEELSAIKGRMKEVMMKAAETGTLAKELEKLLQQTVAEGRGPGQSDLEALGEKLRGVLEEASDTGKLEEALQLLREEQEETMKNAPKDDLEAVRSNLCTVVEDAVDSGKLAAALDALRSCGEPQPSNAAASDQIAVIKAKFRRLLKEALDSGMLAAKVGILKHPGKVPAPPQGEPPHEMEIMKAHLREALQHAAECGQLAEALASARSLEGPEQRSADVEATAVKLRGVLAEAALCGRLEETLKALQKDRLWRMLAVWTWCKLPWHLQGVGVGILSASHCVIADRTMAALPSHSRQRHLETVATRSLSIEAEIIEVNPMAWQCSPKFDQALEEMSEWFKDAGEVESKADTSDFEHGSLLPAKNQSNQEEATLEESFQTQSSGQMEDQPAKPGAKPSSQDFTQAREVANHIYSTAKAVLEQSHHEFLQLLTSIDRKNPQPDEQVGHGSQSIEIMSPVSTDAGTAGTADIEMQSVQSDKQSDGSTSESKQWKRSIKTKRGSRNSIPCSPVSPGLVTRASCCLYGKQEKLHEKRYESPGLGEEQTDKTKLSFMGMKDTDMISVKKVAAKSSSVASSVASDDGKKTSLKDVGRVRLRITPQHFSPLGTAFRDVQVNFLPTSFTIRALDFNGYAWTAHSNTLPGCLAMDRCKYKIDPSGKDVVITLWGADETQSWKGMTRLELTRPYDFQEPTGEAELKSPTVMSPTKAKSTRTPNLKNNFI
eukprot:s846_g18.t1